VQENFVMGSLSNESERRAMERRDCVNNPCICREQVRSHFSEWDAAGGALFDVGVSLVVVGWWCCVGGRWLVAMRGLRYFRRPRRIGYTGPLSDDVVAVAVSVLASSRMSRPALLEATLMTAPQCGECPGATIILF
jgi:hypothetical protein